MLDQLKSKLKPKQKQSHTPCLCGCGSKLSSTIAAHRKQIMKKTNLDSLSITRSVSQLAGSSAARPIHSKHLSHQKPRDFVQPVEDNAPEDPMAVDPPPASGSSSGGPPPLTRVWAGHASQCGREDEDLVSEPGLPESSADEDEAENNGRQDTGDPELLTDDDEPPVHVEISAREQLTADFQLRATRASMSLIATIFGVFHTVPDSQFSTRTPGSR